MYFYSRPYARGDPEAEYHNVKAQPFLLTLLREGRLRMIARRGGEGEFLLTPLREG